MSWFWSNQPVLWDFYIMFLLVASLWTFVAVFCPKHGVTGDVWRYTILTFHTAFAENLHALVGSAASGSEISCRRFCEIYWEYRTAGHLVFWKPWPAVELKEVLRVKKHGLVLWAQRKPNTRLEICKAFQDRLTFLNRHMISTYLSIFWNLLRI